MKKPRILGLIIARKNSKGLKNKHLIKIKNKYCIEWTFEAANKSKMLDFCMLSTDCKKIIKISKKYKINAPFVRPANLSRDKSSIYKVINHSIRWLKKNNKNFDIVVVLQGTSPLRKSYHIDQAIKLFFKKKKNVKTLVSGFKISNKNYWILKKNNEFVELIFKQKKLMRRQDNKNLYMPNGAIFISKIKNLNSFYSKKTILYKMKEKESIDIDTIEDLKLVRRYIN